MSHIVTVKQLIESAVTKDATDIHLVVGKPPIFRVSGELFPSDFKVLDVTMMQELVFSMVSAKQKEEFLANQEFDFSYFCHEDFHSRVNLHFDRGHMAVTLRIMPQRIRSAEELGLPPIIQEIARKKRGLVLIVGTAGSGKTTTLNYIVDQINNERKCKVVTIEDPIELVHQSKQSLIIQREVGSDTKSFERALKYTLRQDPDVVVIGEMRDLESISMALTTAETGHLVLTTLHAPDAIEAINRIIDVYPAERQNQIRVQIGETLTAVIGQALLPRKDGQGRILVSEALIATMPIRNMIRRNALIEIRGAMQTDRSEGMYTVEQCLSDLVKRDLLVPSVAKDHAKYPTLLQF